MEEKMQAVIVQSPGGADRLKIAEAGKPVPKGNEILVKVHATALNRADILQREGKYPPPEGASRILGLEIAGEVSELGSDVTNWKAGDKVFGLIPGGGYAEFAVIHKDMAMKIPDGLNMTEAAAIPEVFLTAYQALFYYGKLKENEFVLIHAGGSGVGTAAIQLAKDTGAKVIITASEEKHETCRKLGAEKTINYKAGAFVDEVLDYTGNKGVNLVIDFIGAPYFSQNIKCISKEGKLIILSTLGGGRVEQFDLRLILKNWISVIGSTLRTRELNYQVNLTKQFAEYSIEKFKTGKLIPVIDSVYNWKDVADAHQYMEANKNIGKIVLEIGDKYPGISLH